jgi:xylulokinase
MLCGLADAVDALVDVGVAPRRVLLIGGAAANPAVAQVATTLFSVPVLVPTPGEYVADGAARQAAWVVSGRSEPPAWRGPLTDAAEFAPAPHAVIRENYADARSRMYPIGNS